MKNLFEMVKNNFPLETSDVKSRLDNLIDRDYIKRLPDNASVYEYIS